MTAVKGVILDAQSHHRQDSPPQFVPRSAVKVRKGGLGTNVLHQVRSLAIGGHPDRRLEWVDAAISAPNPTAPHTG